ncbi:MULTISPECIES: glucosamine inositolphosphorylceramide transferase family protein [unclassified Paenibacillus]|uniref:glucosamine inositolphosphorylceramide transferase family protein n=1 Tax=unclassified Paenibacillus TaxID=185978 RepID=UPI00362B5E94
MSLVKAMPLGKIKNVLSLLRGGMVSNIWAIKVFSANSAVISEAPHESRLDQPSLQASDIDDAPAEFVADPFIIRHESKFYMFFEVLNKASGRGEIGLAVSDDGEKWDYEKIVLKEKYHLSYPQVFKVNDEIFMLPETIETKKVLLYKAKRFPFEWEIACELFSGSYVDPSIFKYENKWWLFAGSNQGKNLHLFYSDHIEGTWTEHPQSPLISNNISITRPGGRIIVSDTNIYRYTQDGNPYYGSAMRVFKINELSVTEYKEELVDMILSGTNKESDWRKDGMHHIDQLQINENQWLIAVDGHKSKRWNYVVWKLDRVLSRLRKYT